MTTVFANVPSLRSYVRSKPEVAAQHLVWCDPDSQRDIDKDICFDTDVGLQAGGSDIYLEDGSEILFTQSAIVLENLIGKFLVNAGSSDEE